MREQFVTKAKDCLQSEADDWQATSHRIREAAKEILGEASGKCKEAKETWWWNSEVQEAIKRKKELKRARDADGTENANELYKVACKEGHVPKLKLC